MLFIVFTFVTMTSITSSEWEKTQTKIGNRPVENPIFVNCDQIDVEEFKRRFYAGFPGCEGWGVVSFLGPHNTHPTIPNFAGCFLAAFPKHEKQKAIEFAHKQTEYLGVDFGIVELGKYAPYPPPQGLQTFYTDPVMDQHVNGYVNKQNNDRKKLIEEAMKNSEENKRKIKESEERQKLYYEKSPTERENDRNASERIDQPVKRLFIENSTADDDKDVDM